RVGRYREDVEQPEDVRGVLDVTREVDPIRAAKLRREREEARALGALAHDDQAGTEGSREIGERADEAPEIFLRSKRSARADHELAPAAVPRRARRRRRSEEALDIDSVRDMHEARLRKSPGPAGELEKRVRRNHDRLGLREREAPEPHPAAQLAVGFL